MKTYKNLDASSNLKQMFINNADKNGNVLTVFELGVSNSDKLSEKKKQLKWLNIVLLCKFCLPIQ